MSFARASSAELTAIRESIRDPLTGRNVMIPFTSKAFFAGSLKPIIAKNEEQLLVKLSHKEFVEMTRTEADNLLEKRIQSLHVKQKNDATKQVKNNAKQSDLPLAYFDIREEYDSNGNEIFSDAVNIAKELEYLQRKEDENLDSTHRVPLPRDQSTAEQNIIEDNQESRKNITDEEHEQLSMRLSELLKFEEQAAKAEKGELQGSGWGKGFLNKKKKIRRRSAPRAMNKYDEVKTKRKNKVNSAENYGKSSSDERSLASESSESTSVSKSTIRSFEPSTFSGVVKERVVGRQTSTTCQTEEPTKKKLSLFAQRRLQEQHDR